MFNKLKDNINLTRASLCLEKITTGNYKQKVKAYDKLKKIPITKEIGLRIIENSTKEYSDEFKDMNINSMLLLLLFNNFNKDFCDELNNIFDDLEENTKLDLLSYLADSDNIDAILLWKYFVIYRFDTDNNKIPIGKLGNNKENYDILFPDLYSVFKTNNKRYSLIILLNSFINLGVVPIDDLKKNKKDLIKHILMPLEELSKFKLNANDDYMTNKEYLGLRYVVECTLNIEYYCNNTKTKALLEKLFKHKDNQLKLFVLESFIKKKKKIKSLNLAPIAKDLRSRYLLYNLLSFYGEEKLMPKKYSNEKDIYESELYNIYANTYNYEKEPESIKFFKKIEREDKEYYLYKFKAKKDYNTVVKDFATDYILKNNHLDKYLEDIEETYIGIAGGREKDDLLTFNPEITKYYEVYDKKKSIDEYLEIFFKKEEVTPEVIDEPTLKVEELEETEKKPSKFRKIFNVNVFYIFQSIVIVILFTILILYINDINVFNLKKGKYKVDNITYKITELSKLTDFNEINGHDIYNGQDEVYYVLVFKKKDVSEYYTFVKTLIENNYKVFYVDSTKEENFFLREPNETGLIITKDRFIKVNNHDFEYYVDGKEFILKELKSESNEVIKQNTIRKIEEENKIEEQQNVENTPNE